jgi:hypothetical protein
MLKNVRFLYTDLQCSIMEDLQVKIRKGRTFLFSIGALLLILVSALCIFINIQYAIIGITGISLFGLCFFYLVYKTFSPKPAITLTNEGIIDKSTLLSTGLIKWEDIKDVKIYDFSVSNPYSKTKQKFLGIIPKEIDKYIESQNWLKRNLLRINENYVDIPINIPEHLVDMPLESLEQEIKKRLTTTQN